MATKITIRPTEVAMAAAHLSDAVAKATIRALRDSANFGLAAVQATIAQTQPRPIASNTYRQAWQKINTPDGARLTNSARHAVFVEIGRRPGPLPLSPILAWVKLKGLSAKDVKIPTKYAKAGKLKRGAQGPKFGVKEARVMQLAKLIRWKIHLRGYKGRHILLRTMPKIQKYAKRQIRVEVAKVMQHPPKL